jgi:hypothetical protein
MVTVAVPVAAVPLAVSVRVLLPVVVVGLKDAVTPVGRPEADRATLPAKLFFLEMLMVLMPLEPWVTVRLVGDAERLKSGVAAAAGISAYIAVEKILLPLNELVFSPVR